MRLQQKHLVWVVLALPFLYLVADRLINNTPGWVFFHWTGVASGVLIMATMIATPLRRLFKNKYGTFWFLRQRRYMGVAAFLYMLAHTAAWFVDAGLVWVIKSTVRPEVFVGWISLILLTPLFLTSNTYSVRKLGPRWKTVQQWTYVAAPAAMLHWLLSVDSVMELMMTYGLAFAVIVALRLAVIRRKPKLGA